MAEFLTATQLRRIKKDVESGVSAYEISRRYNVDKSNVLRRIKENHWTARFPAAESAMEGHTNERKQARRQEAKDAELARRHVADWRTIRVLVQHAIDSGSKDGAEHANACAEAIQRVHAGEMGLRQLVARDRFVGPTMTLPAHPRADAPFIPRMSQPKAAVVHTSTLAVTSMDDMFEAWKRGSDRTAKGTIEAWGRVIKRFAAFAGKTDPATVTRADVLKFRDALLAQGLKKQTIQSTYISAARAVWQHSVDNLLLQDNPFRNVTIRDSNTSETPRGRSRSLTTEEAGKVLSASFALGNERGSHNHNVRRWIPWILAFSGARIGEAAQLRKADVIEVDGIWTLHITPDAGSVKGKLPRLVPIHPQLIDTGFLDFVQTSPDGYLFADGHEKDGLQSRIATAGDFARSAGVTDPRVAPNHGWRHRFKSLCRVHDIAMDYHDAITGHRARRGVGERYGEYLPSALHREICKIPSFRGLTAAAAVLAE